MRDTDRPSILAVHPGALGDVVLFGHLLAAIGGRVTLVAGGEKARLLAGAGVVDAAVDFESLPMHEVFSDAPLGECCLPGLLGRHDRLISCFGGGRERAERRLAAACGAVEAAFLPTRPPADFDGHLTALWADTLGVPSPAPAPWSIPAEWRDQAGEALTRLGMPAESPYVVIHPGAGAEVKCWPLDGFLEVASALRADGLGVVFALGPVELERWLDGRVERLRRRFPVMVAEPLAVLAGVLAGAACYLGNDSGASHLAAAVGTPTLALFGPTDPRHFRPLGRMVEVVRAAGMTDIDVPRVLAALRQWQ